jgi:hypothetical protein
MNIKFEATTLADHVRVECTGIFQQDEVLQLFERVFELTAHAGREAVLVDARKVTGREPTMAERYELAVHLANLQAAREPRIRFAMLGHEPLIHRERFGEIVATNRGAVAGVFTDEAHALNWLLGRPA